jgi:hypothetical protein
MGEVGATHSLLSAPDELGADRSVPDQFAPAPAHHGPRHRGAITNTERHAVESVTSLVDGGEVWNIEEGNTPLCHPISNGGGQWVSPALMLVKAGAWDQVHVSTCDVAGNEKPMRKR